jgi:hypothetical protein
VGPEDQTRIDLALSNALASPRQADSPHRRHSYSALLAASPAASHPHPHPHPHTASARYLGRVSDVSFFNSVRGLLSRDGSALPLPPPLESYEREGADSNVSVEAHGDLEIPDRETADKYIDTYFSTIHVAYPFLPKPSFMEEYESFWREGVALQSAWFRPTFCE